MINNLSEEIPQPQNVKNSFDSNDENIPNGVSIENASYIETQNGMDNSIIKNKSLYSHYKL